MVFNLIAKHKLQAQNFMLYHASVHSCVSDFALYKCLADKGVFAFKIG